MQLTTQQLSRTATAAGVRMPFPFSDCASVADGLRVSEIEPALRAFENPKLVVYAVQERVGEPIDRVAAVESMADEAFALRVLGGDSWVVATAQDALVATVVDVLDRAGTFRRGSIIDHDVSVPAHLLQQRDADSVSAGLRDAGVPTTVRQTLAASGRPHATGVLGAVGYDGTGGHHVTRSVTWRTYSEGGVLAVELPHRSRRESAVDLRPLTARTLNRAAINLLTSLTIEMRARELQRAVPGAGGMKP